MKRGGMPFHDCEVEEPVSADPRGRTGAVVLRGVPLHLEPRALPRLAALPVSHASSQPSVNGGGPGLGKGTGSHGSAGVKQGPEASSQSAQPDLASSPYQQGYRAGYGEAEAALKAAHDRALESGYQAGLARGLEEGRQQGLAEGRKAGQQAVSEETSAARAGVAARLARLDKLLSDMPNELGRRLASAEDDMVAVCHAVVCRLLGEQLLTRQGAADWVRQAVREASGDALLGESGRGLVSIHVHPRDLESLQTDEQLAAWFQQARRSAQGPIHWVADEGVRLGGCMVRSAEGTLDARLETQMAALRELLVRAQPAEPADAKQEGWEAVVLAGSAAPAGGRHP